MDTVKIKSALEKALAYLEYDTEADQEIPGNCWCTDTGTEWGDGVLRCEACLVREALEELASPGSFSAIEANSRVAAGLEPDGDDTPP